MADNLAFNIVVTGTDTAERNVGRMGGAFKDLADQAEKAQKSGDLGPTLEDVDMAAEKARLRVENLNKEFEKSGSVAHFQGIKDAEKDLSKLEGLAKDMRAEIEKITGGGNGQPGLFSRMFSSVRQEIPKLYKDLQDKAPEMFGQNLAGPIGIALVAGITSAAATAITTGVGLGVIGAAALIQRNNPQLVAAFGKVKTDIGAELKGVTAPLVDEFDKALGSLDGFAKREEGNLRALFASVAPAVLPLEHALEGFLDPILRKLPAVGAEFSHIFSDPKVQEDIAMIGRSIATVLDTITHNERLIKFTFTYIADAVSVAAKAINALISVFNALAVAIENVSRIASKIPVLGPLLEKVTHGLITSGTAATGASSGLTTFASKAAGATDVAGRLATAATKLDGNLAAIKSTVDAVFAAQMGLDQANLGVAKSITDVTDALQKNGRQLDIHKAAGQANRAAILAAVQANIAQYDAMIQSGMAADDATKAYDANTQALEAQLRKAGLTQAQIQGLIGKYEQVPDKVNTALATQGLTDAINNLADLIRLINHIPRRVDIMVVANTAGSLAGFALGSVLGHHAGGGSAVAGQPIIVGDAGRPEVFVPDTAGTILPQVPTGGGAGTSGEQVMRVVLQWPDGTVIREKLVRLQRQRGHRRLSQLFPDVEFA